MRILILTYYFPPDLSAGSFRCQALVDALETAAPFNIDIQILTTTPNRYDSYVQHVSEKEEKKHYTVHRCDVGNHGGKLGAQIYSFLSYALFVKKISSKQDYDLIVATSSRLMTIVLAAHVAKSKKIPLFLDIRDIFIESVESILPRYFKKPILWFFAMLEKSTISSAHWINLVSPGFAPYFESRFSGRRFHYFTNGIDEEFVDVHREMGLIPKTDGPLRIVYAGNIGEGQGLDYIIPQLAQEGQGLLEFVVVGDGARKLQLKAEITRLNLKNICIKPPVSRHELLEIYRGADILFLHLHTDAAYNRVLPSKIFEYAATGKPILAGVTGFPRKFILEQVVNAEVFLPGSASSFSEALSNLKLKSVNRQKFVIKFSRNTIMKEMAKSIHDSYRLTRAGS